MERNSLQTLVEWNNNPRKKPLIVWGARQVGKTYLVKEIFAETYYKDNYIYVDFKKEDEIRCFCTETANANKIIEYISLFFGKQINENTLLIFDEVQECPNIISSLKYFCQDFRQIPVIATGSMVRIKIQRETHKRGAGEKDKFLFPVGKINQMTIYPMTFDEFLLNNNRILYDKVKEAYTKKLPLDRKIHELAMESFVFTSSLDAHSFALECSLEWKSNSHHFSIPTGGSAYIYLTPLLFAPSILESMALMYSSTLLWMSLSERESIPEYKSQAISCA